MNQTRSRRVLTLVPHRSRIAQPPGESIKERVATLQKATESIKPEVAR